LGYLKQKSIFNLEAAKKLIDDDNFAPSVHCSYYGMFQFISSKLNQIGITYEKVSEDLNSLKRQGKSYGSHEYNIKLILDQVESKTSDLVYTKNLKDKIGLLKNFRKMSDYLNLEINHEKSTESLRLSNEIISLISNKIK